MADQRSVLVTGGSRGIGAATARLFAARGWAVHISYVTDAVAAAQTGFPAHRADVRDAAQVVRLFDAAGRQDALVINAGITGAKTRLADATESDLRAVVETNLLGALFCAREAVRRGVRSIVLLSSTATRLGSPNQWVHYAATKGAVDTLTAGLAREVAGQGIRVNAVAPGLTLSDPGQAAAIAARLETMRHEIPMARAGTAEEVAEAIFWLCSDAASYVTGVVLPVAGGR
jgi:NAD(P)-dependent dehydrogenase (short-subunit alcohol dehydrogenase family)